MSYGVFIYRKETIEDFVKEYPEAKEILEKEGDWFDSNLVVGFDTNLDNELYNIILEKLGEEISGKARNEFAYKLSKKTFEYGG